MTFLIYKICKAIINILLLKIEMYIFSRSENLTQHPTFTSTSDEQFVLVCLLGHVTTWRERWTIPKWYSNSLWVGKKIWHCHGLKIRTTKRRNNSIQNKTWKNKDCTSNSNPTNNREGMVIVKFQMEVFN